MFNYIRSTSSVTLDLWETGFTSTLNDDEICFNNMQNDSEVDSQSVQHWWNVFQQHTH